MTTAHTPRVGLFGKLVLFLGVLIATGCSSVAGALNTQRAALRGVGDIGVTAYLDAVDAGAYETHKTEIAAVLARLQDFVADGRVKSLVYPKFVEAVNGLVPRDYQNIANLVLDAVRHTTADVDVEQIGEANVARIQAVLEGVAAGLRLYRAEHRPTDGADEAATEASTATPSIDIDAVSLDEDRDIPGEDDGE